MAGATATGSVEGTRISADVDTENSTTTVAAAGTTSAEGTSRRGQAIMERGSLFRRSMVAVTRTPT